MAQTVDFCLKLYSQNFEKLPLAYYSEFLSIQTLNNKQGATPNKSIYTTCFIY